MTHPKIPEKRTRGPRRDPAWPIPFVGGPRHGSLVPPARGRYAHYLDGEGMKVPVRSGDRFVLKQGRPTRAGIYVLRQVFPANHYWYLWVSRTS